MQMTGWRYKYDADGLRPRQRLSVNRETKAVVRETRKNERIQAIKDRKHDIAKERQRERERGREKGRKDRQQWDETEI